MVQVKTGPPGAWHSVWGEVDGSGPGSCLFPRVVGLGDPRNSSPKFSHKRNEGGVWGVGWAFPQLKGSANLREPWPQPILPLSPLVRRSSHTALKMAERLF